MWLAQLAYETHQPSTIQVVSGKWRFSSAIPFSKRKTGLTGSFETCGILVVLVAVSIANLFCSHRSVAADMGLQLTGDPLKVMTPPNHEHACALIKAPYQTLGREKLIHPTKLKFSNG